MTTERLLERLVDVRQTAPGRWLARCPAHDDRSPSMSIRELDDGRVLLHDFGAGCGAADIVAAVGLQLADLFPPRDPGVHRVAPSRSRVPGSDIMQALAHEATTAALIAAEIAERRDVPASHWDRLAIAASRLGAAAHGR